MNRALQIIVGEGEAELRTLLNAWLQVFDMEARRESAGLASNRLTRLIDLIDQTWGDDEPTDVEAQQIMQAHYELACMRDVAQSIHATAGINTRNAKGKGESAENG